MFFAQNQDTLDPKLSLPLAMTCGQSNRYKGQHLFQKQAEGQFLGSSVKVNIKFNSKGVGNCLSKEEIFTGFRLALDTRYPQ